MLAWKKFISRNYWSVILVVFAFILAAAGFNQVLKIVAENDGVHLPDLLFAYFESHDFSLILFLFTYGSLLIFMILHRSQPDKWYYFIKAYVVLLVLRSISVYLLPLSAPENAIPLNDPVLNNLFYPNGYSSRDLFFSGHVATVLLMAFFVQSKSWKLFFVVCAAVIAAGVVGQKVHYTIDVLAAPLFSWVIYKIAVFNFPPIR